MKPENLLINKVATRLKKQGIHCEKMHNPYRGGTADCWYSGSKADVWVEWKWVPTLPKSWLVPNLTVLQKKWLKGRYHEGRSVQVVVGSPSGCLTFNFPEEWEGGMTTDHPFSWYEVVDGIEAHVNYP